MKAFSQRLQQGRFAYGLLLLLGLLTWYGIILNGEVTQLTAWLPQDSPFLANGDLGQISTIWTDFDFSTRDNLGGVFLPVRDTDLLIDFKIFGQNWALFHAGNLMWYLVSCCLFLGICRHLFGPGLPAWTAAALFCVHPLHTENVAWIGGRQDLLSATFFCGAWWLWLQSTTHSQRPEPQENTPRRWSIAGVVLLFVLGVWSSSQVLYFPLVLVLCSLILYKEHLTKRWKEWLTWAVVTFPLWLLSGRVISRFRDTEEAAAFSLLGAVSLQLQSWSAGFSRALWPQDLALHYPSPQGGSQLLIAVIILAFVFGLSWRCREGLPLLALGFGVFFASSLHTNGFNSSPDSELGRHLLLSTMGLALVVGALLMREAKDLSSDRPPWLQQTCLMLILPLVWQSHQQVQTWETNLSLWSASASSQPRALKNLVGQAHAMQEIGQGHIGLSFLNKIETHHKSQAQFYQGRGVLHLRENNLASAEADYQRALSLNPNLRIAGKDLALLLSQSGRVNEAIPVSEHVTQVHPLYAAGFNTLGAIRLKAHHLDEAETAFLQANYLAYENPEAACNLAEVFRIKTQQDETAGPSAKWWSSLCRQRTPSPALSSAHPSLPQP